MRWNELGDRGTMKANGTNNGDFLVHTFMSGIVLMPIIEFVTL